MKYDYSIFSSCLQEAESDIGGEKSDIENIISPGKKIWIDDIREAPEGYIWIKSVNDFIDYCYKNGIDDIELFDTDHDAGDYQSQGGDYIRCFDYLDYCGCHDITIHIHSANPVGANNIRRIITKNSENGWKEIRNTQESTPSSLLEDTTPQDITESIHINLNDETIDKSKCSLIAYNVHVDECDDSEAYNPKKNPDKAIDIMFEYPDNDLSIEIFLDTPSKEWDSWINGKTKLSPEQMGDFFKTDFYNKLYDKLVNTWPSSDDEFRSLLEAIKTKKYKIDGFDYSDTDETLNEADEASEETEKEDNTENSNEEKSDGDKDKENKKKDDYVNYNDYRREYHLRRHKVKKGQPKLTNDKGEMLTSNSGRKLIHFTDQIVAKGKNEAYYTWPGNIYKKDGKSDAYKWSRWHDWNKQRPVARCRFTIGNGIHNDVIGLSISPIEDSTDKNRGWISYDLSLTPILQYLTPQETEEILKLSVVRKFIKEAERRMEEVLSIPSEEIYNNLNNKEKCSLEDINKTKQIMKNTLAAIKDNRVNNFIYN